MTNIAPPAARIVLPDADFARPAERIGLTDVQSTGEFAALLQSMSGAPAKADFADSFAGSSLLGEARAVQASATQNEHPRTRPLQAPSPQSPEALASETAAQAHAVEGDLGRRDAPRLSATSASTPSSSGPPPADALAPRSTAARNGEPTATFVSPAVNTLRAIKTDASAPPHPEALQRAIPAGAGDRLRSSAVHVALCAVSEGLRVIVRAGAMTGADRDQLEAEIAAVLAEHGVPDAQLILNVPGGPVASSQRTNHG